ncbi:MAG: TetR/AcrR family transcriptional regulator [Gammaproteobacteria bacterium]|nr:TetR/AcrR family transcriptional regulator [Gammaproteobacteria bacterium]MDP2346608.1 TetR/AcrR family transcriptional regulator [Gammaproteobacteria bacterium]
MADVLHFDIDTVLDRFLKVFWEKGYKSTTTKELAKNAGISEGSLFNTFRSKKDIYIQALQRYSEKGKALVERMESNESAVAGIREYWTAVGNMAADTARINGCMITNASIEASNDADIRAFLLSEHLRYDAQFQRALDRAVAQGELSADADTKALGQFLSNSLQGIRVLSRFNPDKEKVQNILEITMSALNQYRK